MNPSQAAPGSQASLREANRQRVLEVLREQGALTQVEVAGLTGLSPATVSNVVKELDAGGAVELAPSIRNGRRAVLVSLATGHSLLAAIAFGERDVRVGIGGSPLELLGRRRMPLPADHRADEGLDRASRLLLDVVEESGKSMSDLRAVTVGVPGPVDLVTGHVGSQGILPGWRDVAVADEVREMVKVPVTVENAANLGALGELRSGALQGVDNGVYVKLSYGVGAGLILGGELFRGSTGTAGEMGHLTIDEDGPVCRCGNRGCLETYIGSHALLDALRTTHERLTLRDLVTHALDGDVGCRRVLQDAGRHLGRGARRAGEPGEPLGGRARRRARRRRRDHHRPAAVRARAVRDPERRRGGAGGRLHAGPGRRPGRGAGDGRRAGAPAPGGGGRAGPDSVTLSQRAEFNS